MSSEKDNLTRELDSKLEDLFDEDTLDDETDPVEDSLESSNTDINESKPQEVNKDQQQVIKETNQKFPLDNLNAILLSIDWEISDELISNYLSEIKVLRKDYSSEKYCDYFLRILDNIARYIGKNLGGSHPESVSMMQSIHQGLESIFLKDEISEVEKKKVFYKEYNKYIKFKKKVTELKSGKKDACTTSRVETEEFAQVFIKKISKSLRQIIREELESVKKELLDSIQK